MHPYPYCIANTSKEHSRAEFSGTDVLQVWRSQLHPAVYFCLCLSPCCWGVAPTSWFLVSFWFQAGSGRIGRLWPVEGRWLFHDLLAAVIRNVLWSLEWMWNRKHENIQPVQPQGALSLVSVSIHERLVLIFLLHSLNHVTIFIRFLEYQMTILKLIFI